MSAPDRSPNAARPARLAAAACTFAIWALLAASVLWWLLRAGASAAPAAPVAGRAQADVDSAAVARALGAGAAPASAPAPAARADGRFALRGVLTHGAGGAALVAVGGKVRAVRVGAPVGKDAEGWTLHEAQPHAVVLAAGDGNQTRLEMPNDAERARTSKERAARTPQTAQPARPAPAASTPAPVRQPASRARGRRAAPDGQADAPPGES